MGLSPYLCRVVKRKTKNAQTIYPFMDIIPYEVSNGFINMCRQYEAYLLFQKFHKYIRLTDYTELIDTNKIISKHLKDVNKAIDPIIDISSEIKIDEDEPKYTCEIYLPIKKEGYNYMQSLYYTASTGGSFPCEFKKCKEVELSESAMSEIEIKTKAHTLYFEHLEYLDFKFSSFKSNLPKWFFPYGYIVTDSKLTAYVNYLNKKSYGYKRLKEILDNGGLKDDEFIDLGY